MPRKRRSTEEIIKIIREADTPGVKLDELLKRHGITEVTYKRWREKYGGLDMTEVRRLKELEKENAKLKELAGNQALIIEEFKKEQKKRGWG